MATYAAFLRGLNVGGHTVKNDRLRALFEDAGMARATPFLASGNVLFEAADGDTAALEGELESHLRVGLGYEVATFVRSADELVAIAGHDPFPEIAEGGKLHIGFRREPLDPATQSEVVALAYDSDRVAFDEREMYWHMAGRMMDSGINQREVEALLGDAWTMRTANTVRRLTAKLST